MLNEAVLGEVSFRQLLNLLALNATVGAAQIGVEGLIPVDFPRPEIEDFPIRVRSSKRGVPKTSSFGRVFPSLSS